MLDLRFLLELAAGSARLRPEATAIWLAALSWVPLIVAAVVLRSPWGVLASGLLGWAWATASVFHLGVKPVLAATPLLLLAVLGFLAVKALRPRPRGARWASPAELPAPVEDASVFLGWTRGRWGGAREVAVPAAKEGVNVLALLRTGGGKSSLLARQLLAWPGAAVVLDPKGELWERTASVLHMEGRPVYCLHLGGDRTHAWDPLVTQPQATIEAICSDPAESPGDRYWSQAAAREFRRVYEATRRAGVSTWAFLHEVLQLSPTRAAARLQEIGLDVEADSTEWRSAWQTLATRLQALPEAVALLSGSDFSVADLREARGAVYIVTPPALLRPAAPILRGLWTALMYDLRQRGDPVLALLDEVGVVSPPDLPGLLAMARGYRVSVVAVAQSLSQLQAAYGRLAQSIVDNCRAIIAGASEDLDTCAWVSEKCGQVEVEEEIITTSTSRYDETRTVTLRQRPLIRPEEVRMLPDDVWILFLARRPPALVTRYTWGQFVEPPPPPEPPLRGPLQAISLRPAGRRQAPRLLE
jgi:type IV secretion system protein VirD4